MSLLQFLSENPQLRLLQLSLLVVAILSVFLVFFVTRDALLRSKSFWLPFFAVTLTACLPIIGFLLYLLVRPSQMLKERELHEMVTRLLRDAETRPMPQERLTVVTTKNSVKEKKPRQQVGPEEDQKEGSGQKV